MNHPTYFEIQADDTSRAISFYQEIFGWQFSEQNTTMGEYWRIETEGMAGGLLPRPAAASPETGTNAFTCSMEVESFAAAEEAVLAAGGQVALPKFPIPGRCWQGYFLDTENNVFGIFEVDEQAGL